MAEAFENGEAVNASDLTGCFDLSDSLVVIGEFCFTFDCPELEANIGDSCDDNNPDTEDDAINENCECEGIPVIVFDCPELEANIGDSCNDNNPDTENDAINENCECEGTPVEFDCPELEANIGDACELAGAVGVVTENCECLPPTGCSNFVYYLTDHAAADGIADIYQISIDGNSATMTYITTSEIEVHIAYNEIDGLLYAVSKHENSYRLLDPMTGAFGPEISLGGDYGEITAAVINADGKLLIGSQDNNEIYCVDLVTNVVSSYDTYAPVTGGDLAFASDGMLYLATRSGNGLYEVYPDVVIPDVYIGNVPNLVTGMAITETDQLLISAQGNSSLVLRNGDGSDAGISYNLELAGVPYVLRDGDLASGCNPTIPDPFEPVTAIDEPLVSQLTSYPNPTPGSSEVVFMIPETGATRVEVYDMNGRKIKTLFNQTAQEGLQYKLDFDGSYLPNGIYIYKMTTSKETMIRKFMIAR